MATCKLYAGPFDGAEMNLPGSSTMLSLDMAILQDDASEGENYAIYTRDGKELTFRFLTMQKKVQYKNVS
jgi:hypothetical protein